MKHTISTFSMCACVSLALQVLNNNTFSDYFNDHQVQDAWTATQKYVSAVQSVLVMLLSSALQFKCCGVNNFTDYQLVFGNMSVPISCCNTTNPAGTCPEIISNAQQANKAGLIFSRVCHHERKAVLLNMTFYRVVPPSWSHSTITSSLLLVESPSLLVDCRCAKGATAGIECMLLYLQMIGLITRCIVLQFHSVKATDSTGVVCGRCKLTLASCICMT